MSANPEDIAQQELVSLKINGRTYFGSLEDTILDIAKRNDIDIPHLCFKEGMRPDGKGENGSNLNKYLTHYLKTMHKRILMFYHRDLLRDYLTCYQFETSLLKYQRKKLTIQLKV